MTFTTVNNVGLKYQIDCLFWSSTQTKNRIWFSFSHEKSLTSHFYPPVITIGNLNSKPRDEVHRLNGVPNDVGKKNSILSQMQRCISSSDIDHQPQNAGSTSYTSYSCDDLYLSDQSSSRASRAKRLAKQSSKDSATVRIASNIQ